MNFSMIRYILGFLMVCEGALMLPSCLVAVFYQEIAGFAFLLTSVLCLLIGLPLIRRKPEVSAMYVR